MYLFYECSISPMQLPFSCACGTLQVRFHPFYPEILASGSLDHEVRLWDANTAECIGSRDFCNYLYGFPYLAFGEKYHSEIILFL